MALFYLWIFWLVCKNASDDCRWLAVTEHRGPSPLQSQVKREDGLSHSHFLLSAVRPVCHPADVEILSGLTLLIVVVTNGIFRIP
jgi:hypothetical protein